MYHSEREGHVTEAVLTGSRYWVSSDIRSASPTPSG